MDGKRHAESSCPSLYPFEETLEPLAHLRLGRNAETDENYGNNNEQDQETERPLDDGNQEEYTKYRCDYQKYRRTGEFRHN